MKATIAVIEDNPDNRLLLRAILGRTYDIVECTSGQEGLEQLRRAPPSLVLLDISLPVMDGLEVLREIRRDERLKHLPVIALTAHAMAGDRERFLDAGFDEYVSKPIVDENALRVTVAGLMHRAAP